jgi:hypothetical protein
MAAFQGHGAHADYKWNWQAMPQYLLRFDEQSGRWVPA